MNDFPHDDGKTLINFCLPRRTMLQLTAGAFATALAWGRRAEASAPVAQFQNPLFAGDYADPTILRVG